MVNEEPYQGLKCIRTSMETSGVRKDVCTGAAWLICIDPFQSNLKSKPAHNGETPMFLC